MPVAAKPRYLPAAQLDLMDTLDWIAEASVPAAQAWLIETRQRLQALEAHPDLGHRPRSKRFAQLGYRVLVLGDYLAFYKVRESEVVVYRVLRGSRNLKAALG